MGAVISVNLDIATPGISGRRTVCLGETFVIDIWVEDDGQGVSPVIFDKIVPWCLFQRQG
jgi:hypothetical protein